MNIKQEGIEVQGSQDGFAVSVKPYQNSMLLC